MTDYQKKFSQILSAENVLINEPMRAHTTFKTGGSADVMLLPQSEEQLLDVMRTLREDSLPFFVMGRGSNLLVSDSGYRGAVVKITHGGVSITGDKLTADAGILLRATAIAATGQGLTGLEFAAGIPGTLGGGVAMNAGAYGGELKDFITHVKLLDAAGSIREYSNEEMGFLYRTSIVQQTNDIVLSATFQLPHGDIRTSKKLIEDLAQRRRDKQPLEYPSAGSTFKRPVGKFAGQLIQQSGLKGYKIGGAQVSEKHAGFIINTGNATSANIYSLIKYVQKHVFEMTGVILDPEVHMLGDFRDD